MKKLLIPLTTLITGKLLHSQYVYTIKADSIKITNHCDTAELILENHTQNVKGFLYNKGRGRTEFRKVIKLNDSTLEFGQDTLVISGTGKPWFITGKSGTNPDNHFLGTIDSQRLVIRTDNEPCIRVEANGNIGIRTITDNGNKLHTAFKGFHHYAG